MTTPDPESNQFVACPFCGHREAQMSYRLSDRGYYVECGYCAARGPTDGEMEEAKACWNQAKTDDNNPPKYHDGD